MGTWRIVRNFVNAPLCHIPMYVIVSVFIFVGTYFTITKVWNLSIGNRFAVYWNLIRID